jgi:hypothetical protein
MLSVANYRFRSHVVVEPLERVVRPARAFDLANFLHLLVQVRRLHDADVAQPDVVEVTVECVDQRPLV